MRARWIPRVAWASATTATLLALTYVALLRIDVVSGRNVNFDQHWLPGVIWSMSWPLLGAIVLSKHPHNRLAWVFVFLGVGSALGLFGEQYAIHAAVVRPGALPGVPFVAWLGLVAGNVSWVSTVLIPQLFPDGRALSPRWRRLLWLTLVLITAGSVVQAISPGRLFRELPVENPFGLAVLASPQLHTVRRVIGLVGGPIAAVVLGGSLISLVLRYRRSRGDERQQMKLFVAALLFSAASLLVLPSSIPYYFVINSLISLVAPAAFGVAILRYRLYDIDRVISRTFSYALLTGLLIAVYALLVTGATRLLPVSSSLAVALATLVAAALFQPLRSRVQAAVDRRFNRARYDAERTLEAFSRRLRAEVDLHSVRDDLLDVVATTVQPTRAAVWLKSHEH